MIQLFSDLCLRCSSDKIHSLWEAPGQCPVLNLQSCKPIAAGAGAQWMFAE